MGADQLADSETALDVDILAAGALYRLVDVEVTGCLGCDLLSGRVRTWSHCRDARKHLHMVVQPVTAEVRAHYGGLRSEQLQAWMPADGVDLDIAEVEQFCERARELLRAINDSSAEDRS